MKTFIKYSKCLLLLISNLSGGMEIHNQIFPKTDRRCALPRELLKELNKIYCLGVHPTAFYSILMKMERDKHEGRFSVIHINGLKHISIAFSPDGNTIACNDEHTLSIWNIHSLTKSHKLSSDSEALSFAPDGKTIASASNHNVQIWDIETERCLKILKGFSDTIFSLAYSPDGNYLASGSGDGMICVWHLKDNTVRQTTIPEAHALSVAFSPDGQYIASGSSDKKVRLWELKSGTLIRTLSNHLDWVWAVAFCPDGKTVASAGSDGHIFIQDPKSKYFLAIHAHPDHLIRSISYHPTGNMLASGSFDGTIAIWDIKSKERIRTLYGNINEINSIAYNPQGNMIASVLSPVSSRESHRYTACIWKLYDLADEKNALENLSDDLINKIASHEHS